MFQIEILQGDITKLEVDAIVNAANNSLLGGGGVDGAIHKAAGSGLLEECKTLNGCRSGQAKLTSGYNLLSKFVIHTVGPVWQGGSKNEVEMLESCYRECMRIASELNLKTLAFPSISTGAYGFPKEKAAKIALTVLQELFKNSGSIEKVILVSFDSENHSIYKKELAELSFQQLS
jgi:O-acetyl-ADP-ribose deacetylase